MIHELAASQALVDSLLSAPLLVEELDGEPAYDRSLLSPLSLKNPLNFEQKLGHLYEDALLSLFHASPAIDKVIRGLQVFRKLPSSGRETLGEFDFLIKDNRGTWTHVELATKFYLSVKRAEMVYWPGPDARDHWDRKRKRMGEHQMTLSKSNEGREALDVAIGRHSISPKALVYGCLFDPFGEDKSPAIGVAKSGLRGSWMTREAFQMNFKHAKILGIPKYLWPCDPSFVCHDIYFQNAFDWILNETNHRCAMFTDGSERFFVVSDLWRSLVK